MNLVCLPATVPGDATYGVTPERLESMPEVTVHPVRFATQVWYNAAVRREAVAQIRGLGLDELVLVGFSKSALGAWHIAQAIPELVRASILFDAPVARAELPPWGTADFYVDDAAWLVDSPLRTIPAWQAAMPKGHRLVLISGANFHAEMVTLAEALAAAGVEHVFLPRPQLRHHWQAGWIEAGLAALGWGGAAR